MAIHFLHEPSWSILQVHSQNLKWPDAGWNTPPSSEDDVRPKRRRIQKKSAGQPTPQHLNGLSPEPEDISTNCLCLGLQKMSLNPSLTRSYHCLGSLDDTSENGFRHSFYQGQEIHHPVHTMYDQTVNMSYTMTDMIAEALDGCQSVLRQLVLARDLVSTVLRFYSTPWLAEYITAKDILFIGKLNTNDLAQHLDTLHLETTFHHDSGSAMGDPASSKAYEDAKIQYGVRNITLWCLGTMLLQIASWRQVDATDDVSTIRRLSGMTYCPGPRYQRLTKKCLECDFGCGDDLT
ncbi:Lon protease like peroxisomal [Apiospora saccharicola]